MKERKDSIGRSCAREEARGMPRWIHYHNKTASLGPWMTGEATRMPRILADIPAPLRPIDTGFSKEETSVV